MSAIFSGYAQWVSPAMLPTVAIPMFELRANATASPRILSIAMKGLMAGTGPDQPHTLGIARDAVTGTPLDSGVFLAANEDAVGVNNALTSLSIITRWAKNPTTPSTYLRRRNGVWATGPTTPFISFRFQRGIGLSPSNSLVIWGISFNAAFNLPAYELSAIEVDE